MSFNRHSHARQNEETDWNPPALWNPNAAAAWSLLFTPVFGAALHMLNARAMGDERLRKLNKGFLIGFVLLVLIIEAGAILYAVLFKLDMIFFIFPTPLFTTFLIWYIAAGRRQAALVAEQYGSNYPRRPWLKAILFGILGLSVLQALLSALIYFLFVAFFITIFVTL